MSAPRASLVPFVLLVGLLLSCSTPRAPYVRIVEPLGLPEAPSIYILANRDPQRVIESLEESGIVIARGLRKANLLLRVSFGTSRKATNDCGRIRNVKYELSRANRLVLWIQGRGPTGRCSENIVDKASGELARLLGK